MMRKFLLKTLLAVFTIFAFQQLNAQTETEPNNTAATANTLALNGSIKGIINPVGDVDWYKVKTSGDGAITLTFTALSGKPTYIALVDTGGTTVLHTDYTAGTFSYSVDGLAQGTYYIEVYPYYASDTSSYTITNTLTPASVPNDREPDSTRAQANTLTLNGSTNGHIGYYYNNHRDSVDWYKFTTTGDGAVKLGLTIPNNTPVFFALYDNDGITLLHQDYTAGSFNYTVDGLATGTYYVKIFTYYNTQFAPYTLTDTLTKPVEANNPEPDSTIAQATTLALNGSATGHINYYYNNHRDSVDWYKFTTTGDGAVKLGLTIPNGTPVYFALYDNDGITLLHQDYTAGSFNYTVDGLATGTYFIKVFTYYNTQFAPYTLTDTLMIPAEANDSEPDSTIGQANTLLLNGSVTGHIGYYYNNHRDSADWYKLTTTVDGEINLNLTIPNGTPVFVALYDHDGVTVLKQDYTASNFNYSVDGLAAGTYYVKIFTYYNTQFAPYTLKDTLGTYNKNDAEPNGYARQASTILSNRTTTGHIGFYYNLVRDTTDWMKINYTGTDGNLTLTFHLQQPYTSGYNPTFFQVYQDTSAAPIFSDYFASDTYVKNLTGLAQGYYYIKVFEYYSSQFESYSITDSFTQVDKALISINTLKTVLNSSTCGADSITYTLSGSHSPYTVRLYKNGVLSDSIKTTATLATFKGLLAGNYYATVYGDGATDSAYSKSATSVVTPPVPTALTTIGIGVHTATLNWTKLSCANYYKVQYRAVGSPTWIVINTTGDTSKVALTGLSPYTLYAWEVASVDTTKGLTFTSVFADSITFRTLSDTAHIVLTHKGVGAGCNNDTLTYTSTNSAAPYTVVLYRNGVAYGTPIGVASAAYFYNVPPGNYYAKSTGTGSGGSFGLSSTTQILPPAPTGLDTTMVTPVTATLNWDAVSCSNYYTVQYKVTGTTTWTNVNASTNIAALIGLTPDTKYTWHVSASDSFNNQTVISAYSDTATFMTSSILPVTFVSFSAVLNNGNALLSWSTANEINNKGFYVERSNDGSHFNSIGFVNAQYGHSILNYGFTDNNILNGSDYYRLKQIDVDGNYMYSKIIKLDLSKFAWSINGNPVISNNSNIQLKLDHTATVSVQIVSLNGSVLQTIHKGTINAGNYTIPLSMNNVSAGMYIVKLMVDKQSYTSTIMKQ